MKCNESCRLFGAYQSIAGVSGNVILLHTVVGCQFGVLSQHLTQDMSTLNSSCTVINDKDIIFNGEDSLEYAIEKAINIYNPSSLSIITGCISEIIGDDVESILQKFSTKLPIFHFSGAGFVSKFEDGYNDCLITFLQNFVKDSTSPKPKSINIIGMLYDDYKIEADIVELRSVLGDKVAINCITAKCSISEIEQMSDVALNVVFGRGEPVAIHLKNQFNTPYILCEYPYGIEGSKKFLTTLEQHLDIDFSLEKSELEKVSLEKLKRAYAYIKSFYGIPVGVYASCCHAEGFSKFLEHELGFQVILGISSVDTVEDFTNRCKENEIAILFSSSFDGSIALSCDAPLFPIEYPVFDRVSLNHHPYMLGNGAVNIVNDIINTLMILKSSENKGSMYNEKDMCLR